MAAVLECERGDLVLGRPLRPPVPAEPPTPIPNEMPTQAPQLSRGESGPSTMVSLRPMKAVAESFEPTHPLRVLLMGEPDEVRADEYISKVRGWFRLLKATGR